MAPSAAPPTGALAPDRPPDPELAAFRASVPITSRAALYARWETAVTAPWAPGTWSKLGGHLHRTLLEVIQRVAMVDEIEIQENAFYELHDELWETIRERVVEFLLDGGHARTGLQQVGEEIDAAAAARLNGAEE